MLPTKLIYLEKFTVLTAEANVVEVKEEEGKNVVVLDQTIFYPQGGGQPYDQGMIISPSGQFAVREVRFVGGIVKHIGIYDSGTLKVGEVVQCKVDEARRALHSRLHSAGHVVDMAVDALNLKWTPGKGYHFPDGPYVEYGGSLDELDKEKLQQDIEAQSNAFIAGNFITSVIFMPKEKMGEVCRHVPDYLPEGKPGRVVLYSDPSASAREAFGVACGGTHVAKLRDIGAITIRKIKAKGSTVQVGYDVAR